MLNDAPTQENKYIFNALAQPQNNALADAGISKKRSKTSSVSSPIISSVIACNSVSDSEKETQEIS